MRSSWFGLDRLARLAGAPLAGIKRATVVCRTLEGFLRALRGQPILQLRIIGESSTGSDGHQGSDREGEFC